MARMATRAKKRVGGSFTEEFKAGAVRLVLDEGKTVSQVGRDLDVSQSVVGNWVKQARADRSNGKTGLTTEERGELVKLRREVRELRLQRDILRKEPQPSSRGRASVTTGPVGYQFHRNRRDPGPAPNAGARSHSRRLRHEDQMGGGRDSQGARTGRIGLGC